ncbi:MAG TPA: hypothetical protein VGY58_05970, partial [Gemmataceae bacterium]|nr:hypothetical protein [Gemmataceae bacterium]
GGALLAMFALVVEILAILFVAAGRRSAFGLNAALQAALAAVLLVGINIFSYEHPVRLDWTRPDETGAKRFTIDPRIQEQLRKLKSPTTIVVYQQHKTFGQMNAKPDAYDYAAERKVVEKVKDLVEQFREFGPQFKVHVLDVEEEGYDDNLRQLTKDAPALRQAIANAPENSIFFHAKIYADLPPALEAQAIGQELSALGFYANSLLPGNGFATVLAAEVPWAAARQMRTWHIDKVQRLSFNEFYQLDKTASRQADEGRGNLVLLYQGEQPFARRVLNIDEKGPRVAVLTIHEVLTTQGPEDYGLGGLKKSLTARGFDVRDVLLKKWSEMAPPEAAVTTFDQSRYDALEEQLADVRQDIKTLEKQVSQLSNVQQHWKSATLEELSKEYARELQGRKLSDAMRARQLGSIEQNQAILSVILRQYRDDQDAMEKEQRHLNVDTAAEERHMTDLKAKLDRSLADCDLLFIPRMTLRNVAANDRIANRFYKLDEAQVAAIRDFVKAGKPVLACFGPANEPPEEAMRLAQMAQPGPDGVEELLKALGVRLGKETVLFNAETKAFAERRSGLLFPGADIQVPPVEFEPLADAARVILRRETATPQKRNRLLESMQIAARSRGEKTLDLRVRNPRPIYFDPDRQAALESEPEFMTTSAASWNEPDPFPRGERTPRFEPPKVDDPNKGTLDERRRGPFSIGVAVETPVPRAWYDDAKATPAVVRIAAIGSGGIFTGADLSPAREELLLNTCNWLLGRDDRLPGQGRRWIYPRVLLGEKEHAVWHWGTWIALPAIFGILGLIVVMWRQLR